MNPNEAAIVEQLSSIPSIGDEEEYVENLRQLANGSNNPGSSSQASQWGQARLRESLSTFSKYSSNIWESFKALEDNVARGPNVHELYEFPSINAAQHSPLVRDEQYNDNINPMWRYNNSVNHIRLQRVTMDMETFLLMFVGGLVLVTILTFIGKFFANFLGLRGRGNYGRINSDRTSDNNNLPRLKCQSTYLE